MNRDMLEGNWKQLKGKVREQWGKLTDDDIDVIAGKRDQLAGKLQERYGKSKQDVEREIMAFEERYSLPADARGTQDIVPPRDDRPLDRP